MAEAAGLGPINVAVLGMGGFTVTFRGKLCQDFT